jgi:hypothetical protein
VFIVSGFGLAAEAPWAELLVKRSPFTEDESRALGKWANRLGFDVVFDPYAKGSAPENSLIRSRKLKRDFLIDAFPLAVAPVTDDVPFYFQFHRWRDLFAAPFGLRPPMAMWVLVASLVQVIVLSALLILLPLRGRHLGVARGRLGIFVYFASLGLGFILVEIALLQKLMVFLGGPAYAMAITLSTLLCASGVGSLISESKRLSPEAVIGRAVPATAVLITIVAFGLDPLMDRLLFLPLAGRAAVAALLLAPLGIAMGVPFPAGLRAIEAHAPSLKPWAWGINACATVVGTSACMIIATAWGLRAALLLGAGVYATGYAALKLTTVVLQRGQRETAEAGESALATD